MSYFVNTYECPKHSTDKWNKEKQANSHISEAVMLLFTASQMCWSDYANVNESSGAISTFMWIHIDKSTNDILYLKIICLVII